MGYSQNAIPAAAHLHHPQPPHRGRMGFQTSGDACFGPAKAPLTLPALGLYRQQR